MVSISRAFLPSRYSTTSPPLSSISMARAFIPVSYTHLDVYKRQLPYRDKRGRHVTDSLSPVIFSNISLNFFVNSSADIGSQTDRKACRMPFQRCGSPRRPHLSGAGSNNTAAESFSGTFMVLRTFLQILRKLPCAALPVQGTCRCPGNDGIHFISF